MNDEPMLPYSMHVSAVEAARVFGRQEAEREALELIARLVDAAGGEIVITDKAMVEDTPLLCSDDPINGTRRYFIKRRVPTSV